MMEYSNEIDFSHCLNNLINFTFSINNQNPNLSNMLDKFRYIFRSSTQGHSGIKIQPWSLIWKGLVFTRTTDLSGTVIQVRIFYLKCTI